MVIYCFIYIINPNIFNKIFFFVSHIVNSYEVKVMLLKSYENTNRCLYFLFFFLYK